MRYLDPYDLASGLDHKDQKLLEVRANAYDMVINGVEALKTQHLQGLKARWGADRCGSSPLGLEKR